MVDYNDLLKEEEKIDCLVKKIDAEREKVTKILCDEYKDHKRKLAALEDYYLLLKNLNEKYSPTNPKDNSAQEN